MRKHTARVLLRLSRMGIRIAHSIHPEMVTDHGHWTLPDYSVSQSISVDEVRDIFGDLEK